MAAGGFEVNVGLRIRGGYSRNDFNPKHAFRFYFRSDYGDGKLEYPLFGDEGADEFDVLDLRTEQNYSWSSGGNTQNTFLREVFARDTQGDMGSEYTRSRYHHLYINGVYWGVFMTQERVEEFYSETYFGGDADDYDIVKSGLGDVGGTEISEGNDVAWRQLFDYGQAAGRQSGRQCQRLLDDAGPQSRRHAQSVAAGAAGRREPRRLHADHFLHRRLRHGHFALHRRQRGQQLVRHLQPRRRRPGLPVLHPRQRAFAGRPTSPAIHGSQNHRSHRAVQQRQPEQLRPVQSAVSCTRTCWPRPEYKQLFIDRVQKFMFNGGALTPAANIARFMERKNEVDPAIIAEAARWGDSKVGTPLNKTNWQNEINWLVNTYFPAAATRCSASSATTACTTPDFAAPTLQPASAARCSTTTRSR